MNKPNQVLNIFDKYSKIIDKHIQAEIAKHPDILMYQMIAYFMGYLNEDLSPDTNYGGKRFRPGLCMLLSEYYNVLEDSVESAASIEIFHNFTLIHDDIADGDILRRGRETVWKKWGINHGINTGDAQLVMVTQALLPLLTRNPQVGISIQKFLFEKYLEVVEGQYFDFTYSDLDINSDQITEENTLDMLARKSAVLVGTSTQVPGILAGISREEQKRLWDFGYNLGLAYQLFDDIVSIWGNSAESGKDELMDIVDKKKTLPVIYLYKNSSLEIRERLELLYNKKGSLNREEVALVKSMLDESDAKSYVEAKAKEAVSKVLGSIDLLSLKQEQKDKLVEITMALLPGAKELI